MRATPLRVIARCDVKNTKLIKGLSYEGVRVFGNVSEYAKKYYSEGADEIVYLDAVATLYQRGPLTSLVKDAVNSVHVPISIGGGISSLDSARMILGEGAEKVVINTAALKKPSLISELVGEFGSQCICISIQAKKKDLSWVCMGTYGREESNYNVLDWVEVVQDLGCGEIFLSSVDFDGKCKGMDVGLIDNVLSKCSIPLIASSGFCGVDDFATHKDMLEELSGIAVGSMLHSNKTDISTIKGALEDLGVLVRRHLS